MTPPPTVPARPAVAEASARYAEFTVVDVRRPAAGCPAPSTSRRTGSTRPRPSSRRPPRAGRC
ncbi:hypothetical protein ACFW2X_22630 [Streptomyces antibioticus]|uniref:hypothetical protein n=1 Tax=Streptomyces antibioticus TaxID=1890 RepID=UPI003691BC86